MDAALNRLWYARTRSTPALRADRASPATAGTTAGGGRGDADAGAATLGIEPRRRNRVSERHRLQHVATRLRPLRNDHEERRSLVGRGAADEMSLEVVGATAGQAAQLRGGRDCADLDDAKLGKLAQCRPGRRARRGRRGPQERLRAPLIAECHVGTRKLDLYVRRVGQRAGTEYRAILRGGVERVPSG